MLRRWIDEENRTLGQPQRASRMSASRPIRDEAESGPEAASRALLDHLVRAHEQRLRYGQAERLFFRFITSSNLVGSMGSD